MNLKETVLRWLFRAGANTNAFMTRRPLLQPIEAACTRLYVRLAFVVRGRRSVAPTAEALGEEWARFMPTGGGVRITDRDDQTVYGEILNHCPLRGTGDVDACHRMMAYDRGLLAPMRGHLVVLRSQAEPGVTTCRVAIRPFDVGIADLVPAHVRAARSAGHASRADGER